MVKHDSCTCYASSAASLRAIGGSLTATLYGLPVTVLLRGELGAGKTTFTQGLAAAMGVQDTVTSPTYALEQRYRGTHSPLLHLDLYRVAPAEAERILSATDDHEGVRCVEWPERVDCVELAAHHRLIEVTIREENDGRSVECVFRDLPCPTDAEIRAWRDDVGLPPHIIAHCDAVAELAKTLARELASRGRLVRPETVHCAGLVHDLLRFVDFRGTQPPGVTVTDAERARWEVWKARYSGQRHEAACAAFLREQGYSSLADIVEPHGLALPAPSRRTLEQRILFYADKRVREDAVVSLNERFADFARRYADGKATPQGLAWLEQTRAVERELFGEDVP